MVAVLAVLAAAAALVAAVVVGQSTAPDNVRDAYHVLGADDLDVSAHRLVLGGRSSARS